MKIIVSSFGQTLDSQMDSRFGRAEYFVYYDSETQRIEGMKNPAYEFSGGAGIAAAQQIIKLKADALITGHLGPNAFLVLEQSGIKLFQGEMTTVERNIHKALAGELPMITTVSQSGHRHQGGHA